MNVKLHECRFSYLTKTDRLARRALAAFMRGSEPMLPTITRLHRIAREGGGEPMTYVALADAEGGVIAVYREMQRGELKRLRRWPPAIDTAPSQPAAGN